jgi:two-component system, LytTR family, response regulator
MIRVLIADDEPPARRKVRRFLQDDPEIGEIEEAGSGAETAASIQRFAPDLVFLDVQMPDMDGFAVLEALPGARDFHVVFLTAHQQHALRAFEAEALDYLLKPVDPERFERVLERAKEQVALRLEQRPKSAPPRFLKRILVEKNGREIFLPVERLDWAEADRNYVCLHAAGETYTTRGTLENLARQLDPDQFARISRSELVNLDHVKEMQPWFHGERRMVLKDGRELTWTRRFRASSSRE